MPQHHASLRLLNKFEIFAFKLVYTINSASSRRETVSKNATQLSGYSSIMKLNY